MRGAGHFLLGLSGVSPEIILLSPKSGGPRGLKTGLSDKE